jgi:hypothetical protein
MRFTLLPLVVTITFPGFPAATAVGQDVPTFQVAPTCRAESDANKATNEACLADERVARERLVAQWRQFTTVQKHRCLAASTDIAGMRSYVELLTCLQLAKDADSLPAVDKQ